MLKRVLERYVFNIISESDLCEDLKDVGLPSSELVKISKLVFEAQSAEEAVDKEEDVKFDVDLLKKAIHEEEQMDRGQGLLERLSHSGLDAIKLGRLTRYANEFGTGVSTIREAYEKVQSRVPKQWTPEQVREDPMVRIRFGINIKGN